MKQLYYNLFLGIILICGSCSDYLDIAPDNIATIDYAFRDKVGAEKFLATCYNYMPNIGEPARDPAIMGSDETWNFEDMKEASGSVGDYYPFYIKLGRQTSNNPYLNYWDGLNYGKNLWQGIRNCNTFIESADQVGPQLEGEEKERWIAEVKFLKAFYHYYLMRMYGPIPLMKTNFSVEATTEEVRVYRDTWDDCVNYVIQLIDEAVPHLPISIEQVSTDMGRITQPIALAIKAEILVTSASPLFNGNPDYFSLADNRGTKLFPQQYDALKWEKAAIACKNAIDTCLLAGHDLYEFDDPIYTLSDTTRLLNTLRCVYSDRYNREMIWGMTKNTTYNYQYHATPFFTVNMQNTAPWKGMIVPTFRMVELYYSNNGVPIQEDNSYDYENRFSVDKAPDSHFYYIQKGFRTAKINMNREPRFYANLAFDGSYWFGNGRYKDVGETPVTDAAWPMAMKQGETSGKAGSYRYSITGYWAKKPSHIKTTVNTNGAAVFYRYSCPIIRMADLYLLYAEALNEIDGPSEMAFRFIDLVRRRAGLDGVLDSWEKHSKIPNKPETKEGLRDIIQQERMIELSFESKRFWDLRRWKKAQSIIPGPIRAWNIEANNEGEYYQVLTLDNLNFTTKEYLWPIRTYSIRVNNNLVQNPFWD
ncbi:RagB/SusD family nutrient uptake outer membrane protein [Parabacteroides sp. Marseille-P3160]|uniref:RagB/SusD family nutrient uptake outer membrane protein n=1 Tax=Parabacteroides sp. Marseille-P3160 TaxID=1917887 RepID=UPI0009B95E1D|nr:RagB/SusD family nutrient uptake outer membrane protein [Parabacteroides sp. Marseille-P3160]